LLPHPLYRPDLTPPDYHLFHPLKKDTLQNTVWESRCRKGRELLLGVSTCSCSQIEESTRTVDTLTNTTPSAIGKKFHGTVTCPTYTQNLIKKQEALLSDCSLQFCQSFT
jgi:hypothetical protein